MSPEAISFARAHGFNKKAANLLFTLLCQALAKHKFEAKVVYNLDQWSLNNYIRLASLFARSCYKAFSYDSIKSVNY